MSTDSDQWTFLSQQSNSPPSDISASLLEAHCSILSRQAMMLDLSDGPLLHILQFHKSLREEISLPLADGCYSLGNGCGTN